MSSSLNISLLGRFQVTRGGSPVSGIESDRGRALLAYLAVEGDRPHRRDKVGAILWPDAEESRMRQNLRRALYNLRQTLDLPASEPLLLVTPQDLQLNPKSDHWLDVAHFRALLAQYQNGAFGTQEERPTNLPGRSSLLTGPSGQTFPEDGRQAHNFSTSYQNQAHPADAAGVACHQHLAEAVTLYRGDFLAGFSLPASEPFEEWRLFTQEALHVTMLEALTNLATFHQKRQEPAQAISYYQRQIELEPWREEAHRALMRLFAARGERSAALAQYSLCVRLLNEELGAPPSSETDQLYEQIVQGAAGKSQPIVASPISVQAAPITPTVALPAPITPFIGRQRELTLLAQQLADPACRLITIAGLGGVGKTQLALTAAHALTSTDAATTAKAAAFADGLYFVSLADLAAPSTSDTAPLALETQIATAIVNALALDLQPNASVVDQLCGYLRDKACLLILDNYEHLLGGADLVSQLLTAAPRLKIIATSRQPLHQSDEWLLPVEGLSVPVSSTEVDLARYESVALFVQWARRKESYFTLDADNQGAVVEICQLVDGLPLGIVLAAACYPELTCVEISAEIRRNLIILTAEASPQSPNHLVDLTARHRNIQAVFEASWQLLTSAEQQVLGRAAVFQGGFTRQAGLQITGATLGELSGLVARVLLRRTSAGRYVMHELLRQFVTTKLETNNEINANAPRERHSHYYLDWAIRQAPALVSAELPQAMVALRTELANLRVAWQWASHQQQHELLTDSVEVLTDFYEASGLLGEAEQLLSDAIQTIHGHMPNSVQIACEAKVTLALLRILWEQGKLTAAEAWLTRAAELAQATGDPAFAFSHVRASLHLRMAQGAYDVAESVVAEALAVADQSGDPHLQLLAKLDQGRLALSRHRYGEAQAAIEQAQQMGSQSLNPLLQDSIFLFLGRAAYYQGQMTQAKAYDEQGLQLARTLGLRLRIADHLLHLGTVYDALGDYGAAQGVYQEALAIYRDRGARQHEISVLGNLGISIAYLGDYAGAIRYTCQALELQTALGKVNQSAIAFTNLALFYHQLGEQTTACDYAQQGIAAAQAEGDRYIEGFAHTFCGHAQSALGTFTVAQQEYEQALACYDALRLHYLLPEPQAGLARLWLTQGNLAEARASIEPILRLINERPLEGIEEPLRVYHTCYQVLVAVGEAQAGPLLQEAHAQLQARAERIQNEEWRAAFLTQVAAHRALVVDYAKVVNQK